MGHEFTGWIELKGDRKARVKLCVFEEPKMPTPNESEIARPPLITEWAEIVANMAILKFERIECDHQLI